MNSQTLAYQRRLAAIRAATSNAVTGQFNQWGDYAGPTAPAFAARVAPIVASAQLMAARTTSLYIARQIAMPPIPLTAAQVTGQAARNVDPLEEYQRPFGVLWGSFGDGKTFAESHKSAMLALGILAATDVLLATRTAAEVIDKQTPEITGWVREADAGACELCDAADGMTMSVPADFAIHNSCGCTTSALTSDSPPSEAADPEQIDTQQHDELGATLVANPDAPPTPGASGGKTIADQADWARGQGWTVTSAKDGVIEASKGDKTIAWTDTGSVWKVSH
jgi:hypothetical protein